ncbi:MAG: hypothetical protein MPJ50_07950 [Pirellulales bacterium]|nr:hypothetical protein [Pirellulales bacterium]
MNAKPPSTVKAPEASDSDTADMADDVRPTNRASSKPPHRYSRLMMLSLVLAGMLLVTVVAYFAFGFELITGELGALAALGTVSLILVAQFIRFRERISLRTLLIIITLLAIGLAFFGRYAAEARDESNAVEVLVADGAVAAYGKRGHQSKKYIRTENGWYLPGWVEDWFGTAFFSPLRELKLNKPDLGDAHLALLSEIRQLESLEVLSSGITAEGLAAMPIVPGIKDLSLDTPKVSEKSLERIGQLRDLKSLRITRPRRQGAGGGLPRLPLHPNHLPLPPNQLSSFGFLIWNS